MTDGLFWEIMINLHYLYVLPIAVLVYYKCEAELHRKLQQDIELKHCLNFLTLRRVLTLSSVLAFTDVAAVLQYSVLHINLQSHVSTKCQKVPFSRVLVPIGQVGDDLFGGLIPAFSVLLPFFLKHTTAECYATHCSWLNFIATYRARARKFCNSACWWNGL